MPSRTSGAGRAPLDRDERGEQRGDDANDTTVAGEPQPPSGASTTVKTSSSIAPVIATAPGMS